MRVVTTLVVTAITASCSHAFAPTGMPLPTTKSSSSSSPSSSGNDLVLKATAMDRRSVVFGGMVIASAFALLPTAAPALAAAAAATESATLPNGVMYVVEKKGDGPQPELGQLAAIRFSAKAGDNVIDDIFGTPEPYYTRVGSGGLLKGVEGALPYMRVGDRWTLTIPASLAFGSKGRPASAGKPRIPGDSTIIFTVEMVGLPGKEPELIELIGDV